MLGERADEARRVADDDRRDDAIEVAVVRLAVGVLVVVVPRAQLVRLLEQVVWEFLGRDGVEARLELIRRLGRGSGEYQLDPGTRITFESVVLGAAAETPDRWARQRVERQASLSGEAVRLGHPLVAKTS